MNIIIQQQNSIGYETKKRSVSLWGPVVFVCAVLELVASVLQE